MDLSINEYATDKGILQHPNAYEAFPQTIKPTDTTVVEENGRKLIKAGTIWPSNDENAKGIVLNTTDVTDGDAQVALLYMGTVNVKRLPAKPNTFAQAALPRITWFSL